MEKFSLVFVFALSILFMQSCQKDSLGDSVTDPYAGKAAPQLPSAKTFVMSFTGFEDPKASPKTLNNWGHSVANIIVWNTVLTVHLAIPTLAFYESFNHQPVYQGQGVWLWAYEVSDDGVTYQAELYGELLASEEVKWDMYISKSGGWSQVHWYSGITANDESYANWTLNFNPENLAPFIQIDFQRDNGNGVAAIRYTNIIPEIPENGSYIEYQEGSGAADGFDKTYEVYKAEIDNLLKINWDSVNHNGRVKDAEKFQDEEWRCWGVDLRDTEC